MRKTIRLTDCNERLEGDRLLVGRNMNYRLPFTASDVVPGFPGTATLSFRMRTHHRFPATATPVTTRKEPSDVTKLAERWSNPWYDWRSSGGPIQTMMNEDGLGIGRTVDRFRFVVRGE